MIFQTNKKLGPYLNKWGCFFCSILQKVEKVSGVSFSENDTLTIYTKAMASGAISAEIKDDPDTPQDEMDGVTILQPAVVFNIAAAYAKVKSRCVGCAWSDPSVVPFLHQEEIIELKRHDKKGSHFVSGTGRSPTPGRPWQDEIEFDPIEGGSVAAKLGYIASKRILTIRRG